MKYSITTLSAMMTLAACGGDTTGGGDDGMTVDGGSSTATVEGVPADQFYAQFAYAKTKTGLDGAAAFPENASGNNAFLAHVFLMPNNKLVVFYGEGHGDVSLTNFDILIDKATEKRREGTWHVDRDQLVLDSYLTCDGTTIQGDPRIRCALKSAIVTTAAQGKLGLFGNRLSASGPDDSEFADYRP